MARLGIIINMYLCIKNPLAIIGNRVTHLKESELNNINHNQNASLNKAK
jgi:hypothetical protein